MGYYLMNIEDYILIDTTTPRIAYYQYGVKDKFPLHTAKVTPKMCGLDILLQENITNILITSPSSNNYYRINEAKQIIGNIFLLLRLKAITKNLDSIHAFFLTISNKVGGIENKTELNQVELVHDDLTISHVGKINKLPLDKSPFDLSSVIIQGDESIGRVWKTRDDLVPNNVYKV